MNFENTGMMSFGEGSAANPTILIGNEGNVKIADHFKYLGAYTAVPMARYQQNLESWSRCGKSATSTWPPQCLCPFNAFILG